MLKDVEGLECIKPQGAFYVFVNIKKLIGKTFEGEVIDGSLKFADCALKMGIALIPGVAFGSDDCIRLSYATSTEDIKEGLTRLISFVNQLK